MKKWESDLAMQFTDSEKEKILYFAQKSSIATKVQETNYKILTRWYRVPTALHRFFPQVSDTRWRFGVGQGSMLHVFWDSPKLIQFWQAVAETVKHLTNVDLEEKPAACLLHSVWHGSCDMYKGRSHVSCCPLPVLRTGGATYILAPCFCTHWATSAAMTSSIWV